MWWILSVLVVVLSLVPLGLVLFRLYQVVRRLMGAVAATGEVVGRETEKLSLLLADGPLGARGAPAAAQAANR